MYNTSDFHSSPHPTHLTQIIFCLDVLPSHNRVCCTLEDVDFSLPNGSISFVPGGPRVAALSIFVMDDPVFEGRENFTLQLHSSTPRVNVTTPTTEVSIVDNEGICDS